MDNLCFGMKVITITQLPGGSYSHANKAVDLGGNDSGKDYWYARGETYWKCTCCWYSGTNTYHFLSCDKDGNATKVHCADGVDRVVTVSLTHDNNIRIVGKLYHDEILLQEGTKYPTTGKVTGNHIHLEIAEGDVRKRYKDSNTNTYTLYNELNPLEVMFVDDSFSTVKSTKGAELKHCSSITYDGGDVMTLQDGYQAIKYNGNTFYAYKGYGDYKQLHMLSALGTTAEKATMDIAKFDHDNMVIMAMANCNYFEMSSQSEYGQHYGVEQSEGDGTHTLSLDLAPKNSGYQVVYQLNDGTVETCTADNYWYSKNDVKFACTPYSVIIWDSKAVSNLSSAFGNKEATANTQTMYMMIEDTWCIVCSVAKIKPSVMQALALEYGAKYAFLADSGGSTQMMAYKSNKWQKIIHTGRAIPNVLCLAKIKASDSSNTGGTGKPSDTDDGDGVPQEEYDALLVKYKELQEKYSSLKEKIESIEAILNA